MTSTGNLRILSLLPSATEIVYALGLEDSLIGVTHECDWPPAALQKRQVSFSTLAPASSPAEIDRMVSASIGDGEPIYRLDTEAVRELRPDIVLSQDLCQVCAVPSGHVNEALDVLGCTAEVVSLDPSSIEEVIDCVLQVGIATGTEERAEAVTADLWDRLHAVTEALEVAAGGSPVRRPRTFALEWSDPPFNGGHWVPEMIEAAGGEAVLGNLHMPSVRVTWEQIAAESPEVVVFMPCGYDLNAAVAESHDLVQREELSDVSAFYAVDATSYFSRPGPRLVDGVEILASALHPGAVPDSPPGAIQRVR